MISDFLEGGVKMLDITATWIKKNINQTNNGKSKSLSNFTVNKLGRQLVCQGNLDKKDTIKINVKDAFLRELLELWSDKLQTSSFHPERFSRSSSVEQLSNTSSQQTSLLHVQTVGKQWDH